MNRINPLKFYILKRLCLKHSETFVSPSCMDAVIQAAPLEVSHVHAEHQPFRTRPRGPLKVVHVRHIARITGWWFGTWLLFFHILGIIIPIDELIFFRGFVNHQPVFTDKFLYVSSLCVFQGWKLKPYFFNNKNIPSKHIASP